MLLAVYAMTRQKVIELEIQQLVKRNNIAQLYDEYRANHHTLNLYMLGGILLTGGFALTFFGGGGIDPREWRLEQTIYAIVGLVATVSITLGQRALYRSINQNIAALLVTLLVLAFVIFSEVATTSEREASLVRDRSLDSPTLHTLLKKLEQSEQAPINTSSTLYAGLVAQAQQALEQCKTKTCQQQQQTKLESYQASMQQAERNYQSALYAQQQNTFSLTQQAQSLEYNEQNHTAVIKWIKEHSDVAFSAAMMFASLIFVVAFEAGFHFTGTKEGIYLEAISRLGYSVRKQPQHPTLLSSNPTPKPPTQLNDHSHSRRDTGNMNHNDDLIADMTTHYENAKEAKAGDSVCCPSCAHHFVKRAWNQAFCKPACKDYYWNLVKPERLKAARGANEMNHKDEG